MQKQSIRLFLYSSVAIIALSLVWGWRIVPQQSQFADQAIRGSVEQELIMLSGAVKTATQAMKYRLLDVLKAEGSDKPTRTFQDSAFVSVALIEWDNATWKILWNYNKQKNELGDLKIWMNQWPLAKIAADEVFFAKVGDIQSQAYFAMVMPVRKPNNVVMLGVGVFPASAFGLNLSSDRTREVRVFDHLGFALALTHPAYVGASLKKETLIGEILNNQEVSVRHEWKTDRGQSMLGAAVRMADSNLYASIETPRTQVPFWPLWIYLLLSAIGALVANWALFANLIQPLLKQLVQTEELSESLKRQLAERANFSEQRPSVLVESELPEANFVEPRAEPEMTAPILEKAVSLQKVVKASLRAFEPRIREREILVRMDGLDLINLQCDVLQLQTAVDEVLKNAIEAMENSVSPELTLSAKLTDGRIILTIHDTGAGIPPENLSQVFDPFFSTKDSQGVARGLGLNVVRRVCEEMQGKVVIQSDLGHGTTVTMEWPAGDEVAAVAEMPKIDLEAKAIADAAMEAVGGLSLKDMLFIDDVRMVGADRKGESEADDEFSALPVHSTETFSLSGIRKPKVRTIE